MTAPAQGTDQQGREVRAACLELAAEKHAKGPESAKQAQGAERQQRANTLERFRLLALADRLHGSGT